MASHSVGWKLCASVSPLVAATAIAISRTCDNHHHWQDVTVGSLLGIAVGWTVYRQYYPPTDHKQCQTPLIALAPIIPNLESVVIDDPLKLV